MLNLKSFHDTRKVESGLEIETDLCIIGGGAAGITLVREFAHSNVRVTVLETGGLNHETEVHQLGDIEVVGRTGTGSNCRLRYFGGTTNHWGGHCVPMERIDFEIRDWIPDSGWPFSIDELHPFYQRAHEVIEIGEYNYDPRQVTQKLGFKLFPFSGEKVKSTVSRYNRQRFGIRYAEELATAENVNVYLYATVVSIDLAENGETATHVVAKNLAGNEITVKAKFFILASGGIENPRLLLDSNHQQKMGIGNSRGLVGRYFMEHVWYPKSLIMPKKHSSAFRFYFGEHNFSDKDEFRVRGHIALTQETTRELRIPKFRAELAHINDYSSSFNRLGNFDFTSDDVWRVFGDPGTLWDRVINKKAPSEYDAYILNNYAETIPNAESRVTLSETRNALGQCIAKLDWRLSDLDRKGLVEAHRILAHEIGRSQFGRFQNQLPEEQEAILEVGGGGCHHMGTTRMHDDPAYGVVDRNCRLHDCRNIYLAGSSVFPCAGWSNPTLTIVALALRLADHLKSEISSYG